MISTNYGLTGGTLDSTKHLESAIPRLLTGVEQAERDAQLRGPLGAAIRAVPTSASAAKKTMLN